MYVLEGVTPCIQSMMLQAGDTGTLCSCFFFVLNTDSLNILMSFFLTVTFSRVDPGGKLIMGFRKATHTKDIQVLVSYELFLSFFLISSILIWNQSL